MTLLLLPLGALAEEAVRYLLHHRSGLTLALAGGTGWAWHRARRTVINPGHRVLGRDTPTPREVTA